MRTFLAMVYTWFWDMWNLQWTPLMARAARWRFNARRSQAQRKADRKNVILLDSGVTKQTQLRYATALAQLLPVIVDIGHLIDLDEKVTNWIQQRWEAGDSLHVVSDALCGLHYFEPWTRRGIPTSWRVFSTWRKLESPSRAPPVTDTIIYAIANYAVSHRNLPFASLILLGFFGLLRTGEMLAVRPCDILVREDRVIVSLFDTKTSKKDNVTEMVSFQDAFSCEILSALLDIRKLHRTSRVPIWLYSPQSFRNSFKRHLARFDLLKHEFRPYSLRRGGATHLFQVTGSMESALLRGRWGSSRVARIYISDALSYLPGMTFTHNATQMLKLWSPFWFRSLQSKKKGSWNGVLGRSLISPNSTMSIDLYHEGFFQKCLCHETFELWSGLWLNDSP